MSKRAIFLVMFAILLAASLARPGSRVARAGAGLDFGREVKVESAEGGYACRNEGGAAQAYPSLAALLAETERGAFVFMPGTRTAETLRIGGGRDYEFKGEIEHDGPGVFVSLDGDSNLSLNALALRCSGPALRVRAGTLRQKTGEIVSDISRRDDLRNAVVSAALIEGGFAQFSGRVETVCGGSANFGRALRITGDSARVEIDAPALIVGGTGAICETGRISALGADAEREPGLVVRGGTVAANRDQGHNSDSGFGIDVISSNSAVRIEGGRIEGKGGPAIRLRGEERSYLEYESGAVVGGAVLIGMTETAFRDGARTIAAPREDFDIEIDPERKTVAARLGANAVCEWAEGEESETLAYSELSEGIRTIAPRRKWRKIRFRVGAAAKETDWIGNEFEGYRALYAPLIPFGREIAGWELNGARAEKITEAGEYRASTEMRAPDEIEFEIGENEITAFGRIGGTRISAEDMLGEFAFEWRKTPGGETVGAERALRLAGARDNGTYELTIRVKANPAKKKTGRCEFNAAKRSYSAEELERIEGALGRIEGTYCGKRLGEYALPEHFAWVDPDFVPTCATEKCRARYNADPENMYDASAEVEIALKKAKYAQEFIDGLKAGIRIFGAYDGRTLDEGYGSRLPEHFAWKNGGETPVCAKTEYAATYNADPVNWETFETFVEVRLEKGVPAEPGIALRYIVGRVGRDEILRDLRALCREVVGEIPAEAGSVANETYRCAIRHNPDEANYVDLATEAEIAILEKFEYSDEEARYEYPAGDDALFVAHKTGRTLRDVDIGDRYAWADPSEAVREGRAGYRATYLARDPDHKPHPVVVYVVSTRRKSVAPSPSPEYYAEYAPSLRLRDVKPGRGYEWKDADAVPKMGRNGYAATYSEDADCAPADAVAYVTVKKRVICMPEAALCARETTYDGTEQAITIDLPEGAEATRLRTWGVAADGTPVAEREGNGATDAGTYTVAVEVRALDPERNEPDKNELKITLRIKKAKSEIPCDPVWRAAYDGKAKEPRIGRINAEQEATIEYPGGAPPTEVGTYAAIARAAESRNYEKTERRFEIRINRATREITPTPRDGEEGTFLSGSVSNAEIGVDSDFDVRLKLGAANGEGFRLDVVMPESARETGATYAIRVNLPKNLRGKTYAATDAATGAELAARTDGDDLVLEVTGACGVRLIETGEEKRKLGVWESLAIGLAAAAIAALCAIWLRARRRREKWGL